VSIGMRSNSGVIFVIGHETYDRRPVMTFGIAFKQV
jgi:hypothetical protein